ncbi:MAG: hypothetical protein NTX38_17335 [Methylobacter sp.]|nr:hypothetical protein [Methylobacter sp.]
MCWSPELIGQDVSNDKGDFNMQKSSSKIKKINLSVLTNILKESEIVRASNYGEILAQTLIHPIFGEITVIKTSGDNGYLFHN